MSKTVDTKGSERYVRFWESGHPPEEALPSDSEHLAIAWTIYGRRMLECEVWVVEEEEGGYSAFAARLPGVVAQADEAELALFEIGQALGAAIASYLERGELVPWTEDPIEIESDKPILKRWILVNA